MPLFMIVEHFRNGMQVRGLTQRGTRARFAHIAASERTCRDDADKDAVDNYVGSMQAITKKIFADFEKTYLTCS